MPYSIENNESFINPYAFIPINSNITDRKSIIDNKDNSELLYGILKCKITTKTPMAIPDTEHVTVLDYDLKEFGILKYPGTDKYMIPASSIRGAVRSVYETATESCLSTIKDNTLLSKRARMNEAGSAGLLIRDEHGEWKLYNADRYEVLLSNYEYGNQNATYAPPPRDTYHAIGHVKVADINGKESIKGERMIIHNGKEYLYGEKVFFSNNGQAYIKNNRFTIWKGTVTDFSKQSQGTLPKAGYVFIGEVSINHSRIQRKHGESIFVQKNEYNGNINPTELIAQLDSSIATYRDEKINNSEGHSGYRGYERAREKGVIPVWIKNNHISLGAIGRIVYNTKLNQIVGRKNHCLTSDNLCKACSLFGMVGTECIGSRIRFTDAISTKESIIGTVILKELGTPRNSYLKFYSRGVQNGYDDNGAEISGRKYYWHNPLSKTCIDVYSDTYNSFDTEIKKKGLKRRSKMSLIGAESEFEFDIFYDGISQTQLDELIWSLTFGENAEDSALCNKMGHGKSIGLGSVKITIDEKHSFERKYDKKSMEYSKTKELSYHANPFDDNSVTIKSLIKICTFDALSAENSRIGYPYISAGPNQTPDPSNSIYASFHWFAENNNTLPDILSEQHTLHPFKLDN